MSIFNKVKWILGIVLVFLIILTTNLVDRRNFMAVRNSIETIYADRLVAQDIIFDLSKLIWQKQALYNAGTRPEQADIQHDRIDKAIVRFSETRLTEQEATIFNQLRTDLEKLKNQEIALLSGAGDREGVAVTIATVQERLDDLSDIQLKEGKRQLFEGKKAISSADLFTQIEIGALVILALAVQIIILYTPKTENLDRTARKG